MDSNPAWLLEAEMRIIVLLGICILFFIVMLLLTAIVAIFDSMHNKKLLYQLSRKQTISNIQIDESIPHLLELFVNETFVDHLSIVYGPARRPDAYITDEMEIKLRTEMVQKITDRMSDMLFEKLCEYYSLERMGMVLGDKVYNLITNYVIDSNAELSEVISGSHNEVILN